MGNNKEWKARITFYQKKADKYRARHPHKEPSFSTIKRWKREFEEKEGKGERFYCQ